MDFKSPEWETAKKGPASQHWFLLYLNPWFMGPWGLLTVSEFLRKGSRVVLLTPPTPTMRNRTIHRAD